MTKLKNIILATLVLSAFTACKKDKDPVIVVPASAGTEKVTFSGIAGSEPGSQAANAVYLDLSTEKTTPVLRASWDLGFFNGNDYRVILNNTTSAGVKVLDKYSLADVGAEDTIGLTLAVSQTDPQTTDLAFFDDIPGDLGKTAIPAISDVAADNPVIILNRGTGGGVAARPWVKLRVLRNGTGYKLEYAGIEESTFKTIEIPKNPDFNFQHVSIDNGLVSGEPEKAQWDLVWTYSVFEFSFGNGIVPYNFSDLIAVNYLAGVQVKEKVYADANAASAAFQAFNKDSVATITLTTDRWAIGSNWRSTMPATGARQDRFYIIKDAQGNFYKFKPLAMGSNDGGTRGKPDFKYALIAK